MKRRRQSYYKANLAVTLNQTRNTIGYPASTHNHCPHDLPTTTTLRPVYATEKVFLHNKSNPQRSALPDHTLAW